MPRSGKCPNYAGCLLAYRAEVISISDGEPFACPECKTRLLEAGAAASKPVAIKMIILGGISLLVIMGASAVWYQARRVTPNGAPNGGQIGSSFEQAEVAASKGELLPSRHLPAPGAPTPIPDDPNAPIGVYGYKASPAPGAAASDGAPADGAGAITPPPSGIQAQAPNLDLHDAQTQQVKTDVLKRIDLMPTISSDNKDKLYMSVERARQMGKILTIPFPSGHTAVNPNDVDQLRTAIAGPTLQPFLRDPTCVLVILGFADIKGDEKSNLRISTQRAQSVLSTLQDKCGVLNVLHAVGMGGSTLFGNEKDAERNRVVEIWAVLP